MTHLWSQGKTLYQGFDLLLQLIQLPLLSLLVVSTILVILTTDTESTDITSLGLLVDHLAAPI